MPKFLDINKKLLLERTYFFPQIKNKNNIFFFESRYFL